MNIRFRLFHGPNIHTPFAAVMAEFASPYRFRLPAQTIETLWRQLDDGALRDGNPPPDAMDLAGLAALLAVRLQHPGDPENAEVRVAPATGQATSAIWLGYVEAASTRLALIMALELAVKLFQLASGQPGTLRQLAARLEQMRAALRSRLPQSPIIRTLIREARLQGIPVHPVAEFSRTWLFGQGKMGFHFHDAASERDSFTGIALARDKVLSNRLVRRLGYPGVVHAVATNAAEAVRIARQIGYPVAVKPIASGRGQGVSAGIANDQALGIAFAGAAGISPRGVIIERHVAGCDHRLAVFGGRLAWVAARHPASVVGDGHGTISELIGAENRRRREDPVLAKEKLEQLVPDQDMHLQLARQGLAFADRPAAGARVYLRSIANVAKGGTVTDVTDLVHPDNREMAEAIARSFRLDAMGLDFMTPDISRSWRDVPCAVIEVNGTPGIFYDSRAASVLRAKFPAGSDGRIPSVLLVAPPPGLLARVSALLAAGGLRVGQTDGCGTRLGGHSRCMADDTLPARVMALISDPACEALAIEVNAEQVLSSGLPLDRVALALSFAPLPPRVRELLGACSGSLVDGIAADASDDDLRRLLTKAVPVLCKDPRGSGQ